MLTIYNTDLTKFHVRIVREGEVYGREDCLTHDKEEALVEFYDATVDPEKFGPRGQFVSRYYVSTLVGDEGGTRDLFLLGHEPAWYVDVNALEQVRRWLCVEL